MWHFLNSKKTNLDMESLLQRNWRAYRLGVWWPWSKNIPNLVESFIKMECWNVLFRWILHLHPNCSRWQIMSKSQTVYIEQNNGRQRHWFSRFRRKSIVVSKTLEMIDLTMALFARFHVNGSWKEIAPLLCWNSRLVYAYSRLEKIWGSIWPGNLEWRLPMAAI